MRPPGVPHWTDDECQFLTEFVAAHGHNWVRAARELRDRFGDRRPYASDMIRKKWRQICLKTGMDPGSGPNVWSEVEDDVLVALVHDNCPDWATIAHGLVERLGPVRKYTARQAKARWLSLPEGRRHLPPPPSAASPPPSAASPLPWTPAHDDYLAMLMAMYPDDWAKMGEIFAKRFGPAFGAADDLRRRGADLAHQLQRHLPSAATSRTQGRRRRVDFESSSEEAQVEPRPKLLKAAPRRRRTDTEAPATDADPQTSAAAALVAEAEPTSPAEAEPPEPRPRAKSCHIQ